MPAFLLACLAYLGIAVPSSTLGLLWPSMRLSFGEPVGALGFLLVFGVSASVMASAATGRVLSLVRVGPVVALGTLLSALALAAEALAPSVWVFTGGIVIFGVGFGLIDSALNAHAARHFGARDVNWMHASYGLGAIIGPLLVTALLGDGITWRWAYGAIAVTQVGVACVLTVARRNWGTDPACSRPAPAAPAAPDRESAERPRRRKPTTAVVLTALAFTAAETGIESGAGIWGYIFLTAGRGLQRDAAGVAVSAYWATMFLGRVILGPAAERIGPARVLAVAVAGVPAGAALMAVPGPRLLAVIGMMTVGLAAAPIFPLLTLTTAQRAGAGDFIGTTRAVSLQVAASALGAAAVPAGLGLAIGAFGAGILAPLLLALGLVMGIFYGLLSRAGSS